MHLVSSGVVIPPPLLIVPHSTPLPQATRPPSFTLISASHDPCNGDLDAPALSQYSRDVLTSLLEIPAFEDLTTLVHVPKGAARRFGVLYAASFWYQNIAMECSPDHQRFYSLLCYNLPLLILHDDRVSADVPGLLPTTSASAELVCTRKRVRDRLALAEQGQRDVLIHQLLQSYKRRAARTPGPRTSPSFQKLCELACAKASGRCFRAAAQLLTVTNCPPISRETFNLTKALFITTPRTASETQQWNASVKRIQALPASTLPTITQKAVAHRLLRIRSGAQPGCSRSRNSHLTLVLQAPWA